MNLTATLVASKADDYREEEPLYAVEREQLETLPTAFTTGTFGRRDAEWVVRWYFRRFLGAYPDAERRATEERFARNDFDAVSAAVDGAATAADVEAALDHLTALAGVDVAVGSAFLFFLDPDSYVVGGEREWDVLRAAGELPGAYPDPPSAAEYETYLATCRTLTRRLGCDTWTLYRALWRLWKERSA